MSIRDASDDLDEVTRDLLLLYEARGEDAILISHRNGVFNVRCLDETVVLPLAQRVVLEHTTVPEGESVN